MPHPKKKSTKTSKKNRASHFALKNPNPIKCEKCGEPTVPHKACASCGTYKGKPVLDTDKRIKRAQRNKGKK